jgi:hypothetical protein
MRRREQHTSRLAEPQRRDLVATQMVNDRDHVIYEAFDQPTVLVGDRVRRTRAPRVEPNVPAKRRQAVQEPDHPRLLPHHVDGNHWRTIHQHIDRTVPDRLVRNLTATSDGRVPGLDVVVHPYSTAPSHSRHNRKVRAGGQHNDQI